MPTIRDMGIEAAFTPTPNLINDPSILLSALALHERKRTNRADEAYRDKSFSEGVRRYDQDFSRGAQEFDRAAGQRDRSLNIDARNQRMREQLFGMEQQEQQRRLGQEAASQGMFADLADHMGVFATDDGRPIPGARERFQIMTPDDQQRAIGLFQEEQTQKQQAAQLTKLQTLIQNASANKLMDPAAAEMMMGQAQADPANIDAVYKQAQDAIGQTSARNADMQNRQVQGEMLTQVLPMLGITPERQAAYSAMLLTDPDASPQSILKMALEEQEQREADRMAGEQLRMQVQQNAQDLLTLNPQATPEQAGAASRLRANKIPVDPDAISGGTQESVSESDSMAVDAAKKRYESLAESGTKGEKRKALRDYAAAFQAATGKPLPGADDLAPDDAEMDRALKQAKRKLGKDADEEAILAEAERIIYEAK